MNRSARTTGFCLHRGRMTSALLLGLALLFPHLGGLARAEGAWAEDYAVATKLAARQKRRIFVLFTNSKTCVPCRMLKDAVLSQPEFLDYAAKHLVLLQIDYAPYHNRQKTLKQIEEEMKVPKDLWMKGRGPWPYLFVLSPKEEVLYSGTAHDPGRSTVADYLKFLEGLKQHQRAGIGDGALR